MNLFGKAATKVKEPFSSEHTAPEDARRESAKGDHAVKAKASRDKMLITDLDRFTSSKIFHMNYLVHAFKKLSHDSGDWTVSRFYPYSKDGTKIVPTYVDMPKTPRQMELCKKKYEVMKALGHRYLVYRPEEELKAEDMYKRIKEGV